MKLIDIIIFGIWFGILSWHLDKIETKIDTTNKILIEIRDGRK